MERRKTAFLITSALLLAGFAAWPATLAQTSTAPQQQAPPSPNPVGVVRFAFGGNVAEVPADFAGGLILVPLHINQSQPCLFVLDSTARSTSIDPRRAAELGIPAGKSAELEFAGVHLTLPDLPQISKPSFAAQFGRTYEGTLGRDFFESFVVAIDYARNTVRLYDPAAYHYSGHGKSFHFSFSGDMPVIPAKFNMNGKTLEANLGIDTAQAASVVFSTRYASAHRMLSHVKTIPAMDDTPDDITDAVLGRMRLFQIGPFDVLQSIATFEERPADTGNPPLAGTIGGGMLRRFSVVLDYPHQQIIFDPNSEHRTEDIEDMSGVSLIASGPNLRTFEVVRVRPGTPGADAGLQRGDIIAGIDQDPAADLSLIEVRELFRRPGHPYQLTVQRSDQTLHLTMKLRRLLPENQG